MKMLLGEAVKHDQGIMAKNMIFAIIQYHDGMSVVKMTNYGKDDIFLIDFYYKNLFGDKCTDLHDFGFVEL